MSLWITCVSTVLLAGKDFAADFISLALIASGVMLGPNFSAKSAAAPDTMGAAMLVPLNSFVEDH
jgi:hypothetical protein